MDLYELLGSARGATLIEIKRSYKRLARKYHPDINPGDHAAEARFKEITRAYETLSDPERRLRYDAGAVGGVERRVVRVRGLRFLRRRRPEATTFGDLFAEVFTSGRTGRARAGARRRSPRLGFADLRRGDARRRSGS